MVVHKGLCGLLWWASTPLREQCPCQNNTRRCLHIFWKPGIWRFHFRVVHEGQVFAHELGLGMLFWGC